MHDEQAKKAAAPEVGASTFSKAHFVSDAAGEVDIDDPEFWTKAIGLKAGVNEEDMDEDALARSRVARQVCA